MRGSLGALAEAVGVVFSPEFLAGLVCLLQAEIAIGSATKVAEKRLREDLFILYYIGLWNCNGKMKLVKKLTFS